MLTVLHGTGREFQHGTGAPTTPAASSVLHGTAIPCQKHAKKAFCNGVGRLIHVGGEILATRQAFERYNAAAGAQICVRQAKRSATPRTKRSPRSPEITVRVSEVIHAKTTRARRNGIAKHGQPASSSARIRRSTAAICTRQVRRTCAVALCHARGPFHRKDGFPADGAGKVATDAMLSHYAACSGRFESFSTRP